MRMRAVACHFELVPFNSWNFSSWKHSLVQPISKNGDRSNPSNYRSISITCFLSKVFELVLNNHLIQHVENNSLFSITSMAFEKQVNCSHVWEALLPYISLTGWRQKLFASSTNIASLPHFTVTLFKVARRCCLFLPLLQFYKYYFWSLLEGA